MAVKATLFECTCPLSGGEADLARNKSSCMLRSVIACLSAIRSWHLLVGVYAKAVSYLSRPSAFLTKIYTKSYWVASI